MICRQKSGNLPEWKSRPCSLQVTCSGISGFPHNGGHWTENHDIVIAMINACIIFIQSNLYICCWWQTGWINLTEELLRKISLKEIQHTLWQIDHAMPVQVTTRSNMEEKPMQLQIVSFSGLKKKKKRSVSLSKMFRSSHCSAVSPPGGFNDWNQL